MLFSGQIRYWNIWSCMTFYLVTSFTDMQALVPMDSGAGTRSYRVMSSNTTIWISSIFRDRALAELIKLLILATMLSMFLHQLMWSNRLHYNEFIYRLNCHFHAIFFKLCGFRQLQIHKQFISKCCMLMQKHLVIQHTQLEIDILNINATFQHWWKSSE